MKLDSTVVVCAHNEEAYIENCLSSIIAQAVPASLIILVLDRCTDRTGALASRILNDAKYVIIEKPVSKWKNSISENLELARQKAVGDGFVIVDADMAVPPHFLEKLLPQLSEFASVSALAQTDRSRSFMNRLVSVWEWSYRIAPFGQQPRGGARAIARKSLDAIGGFRDVIAWDTDVDIRLSHAGYKVKLDTRLRVLHRRKMGLTQSIAYQVQAGKARRELGVSFNRTLLHSVARLRPFVLYGYIKEGNRLSREGL